MQYLNRGNMTQTDLNTEVSRLKTKLLKFTNLAAEENQMKDPNAEASKHRQRFLMNVIYALDGYLLATGVLTEDQILYTIELGICAGQSCSQ